MKLNEVATVLTLLRANSSFSGFFNKCPGVYFDAENLPAKAHVELSRFSAPMPTFSLVLWEGQALESLKIFYISNTLDGFSNQEFGSLLS